MMLILSLIPILQVAFLTLATMGLVDRRGAADRSSCCRVDIPQRCSGDRKVLVRWVRAWNAGLGSDSGNCARKPMVGKCQSRRNRLGCEGCPEDGVVGRLFLVGWY
ncbi:hypothetical protein BKA70DRAFT_1277033 [Coprinopsis sp. MPI-PUGE-AT-0042]|nr:hypothetical protein BKA70DRAFT_1277033 [Coprinopsis sp. MPI-PUGE-AT-0042]